MIHVRPATPDDEPAILAIDTLIYAQTPPPAGKRVIDVRADAPDAPYHSQIVVAEIAGAVVGFGSYHQFATHYHPQRFELDIAIDPAHQFLGAGRAIYAHLLEAIRLYQPASLRSGVLAHEAAGIAFLQRRGFAEDFRWMHLSLDVHDFEPQEFLPVFSLLDEHKIEIISLQEAQRDPEWLEKLYDLQRALLPRAPSPEPRTLLDETAFASRMSSEQVLPEAFFIARQDGYYLGQSSLHPGDSGTLRHGVTATREHVLEEALLLGLKLSCVLFAQRNGYPTILTWSSSEHRQVNAINHRFGFEPQYAWISMFKELVPSIEAET